MERQTFERALHAWDKWHDSIEQSRKLLDYDPTWPRDTCIGWIEKHYPAIRRQAEDELKRMGLPPALREYWEDCFYSDYKTRDGKTDFSKITRRLSEGKSLPELPCSHGVVWYEDEDIHDPWLRVEIRLHAGFATKELFDYAARLAYEAVKIHRWRLGLKEHPVCRWLKGGRPLVDEERALECAQLKDEEKWSEKDIGIKFGWALQKDNYEKLTQCRTARRYIRRGRELRKKRRDINPATN